MLFIIIYHYLFLFLHRPLNTTCSVGYVNTFLSCTRITISSTDLYQTQTTATICGFFCSSAEMGVIQTIYVYVVCCCVYRGGLSLVYPTRIQKVSGTFKNTQLVLYIMAFEETITARRDTLFDGPLIDQINPSIDRWSWCQCTFRLQGNYTECTVILQYHYFNCQCRNLYGSIRGFCIMRGQPVIKALGKSISKFEIDPVEGRPFLMNFTTFTVLINELHLHGDGVVTSSNH